MTCPLDCTLAHSRALFETEEMKMRGVVGLCHCICNIASQDLPPPSLCVQGVGVKAGAAAVRQATAQLQIHLMI